MSHVTIIIALYNAQDYIEQCLQSLINQSYSAWDAIIVDDASTDASLGIARRFAETDARFHIIEQPVNQGPCVARNLAIQQAQGTYIAFLDSDDYLLPHALETIMPPALENGLDLLDFTGKAFYETKELEEEGFGRWYEERESIEGVFSGPELFCAFQQRKQFCCTLCFHLVKRQLLLDHNISLYPGIMHEDELFSPLVHAYATRAQFINQSIYMRRVRASSRMSRSRGIHNVEGMFAVTSELSAWLHDHASSYQPEFVQAFAQRIWELREIMARDIAQCSKDELSAFTKSLSPNDAVTFEIEGIQHAAALQEQETAWAEFLNSRTWKLGNALATPWRALRKLTK